MLTYYFGGKLRVIVVLYVRVRHINTWYMAYIYSMYVLVWTGCYVCVCACIRAIA